MGEGTMAGGHGSNLPGLLERATIDLPEGRRARYEILLSRADGRDALKSALAGALPGEPFTLESVLRSDPEILLLSFVSRRFGADASARFEFAYALVGLSEVERAQPDFPTALFPEPRPPGQPSEEGFEDFPPGCWAGEDPTLVDPLWAVDKVRARDAWKLSAQSGRPAEGQGIVIAQPDTGVVVHLELERERRVASFDFLDGDNDPEDPLDYDGNVGHGTGTGSVALSGRAGRISGTAPAALHMPIRCIESVVRVSQVAVAQAIDFAVGEGAHVITMSLGGLPSISLGRALDRAVSADVIVLAAAGNCVGSVVWPARYDDCIAVAGTDKNDLPWRGSCHGYAVDWSAPAENVYRARPDGKDPRAESKTIGQGEGTSFAVALSAGVAALWLAHHGRDRLVAEARRLGETVQSMFRRLVMATARRPSGWNASGFGAGVIDAETLLKASLDFGRGEEAVLHLSGGPERAVETLVAERLGADARDASIDYGMYGPELANILLTEGYATGATDGGDLRLEARAVAPETSRTLLDAVKNPKLRGHLAAKA